MQQLRALSKAMEASAPILAHLHVNLALACSYSVLSATKMVRHKHHLKLLRAKSHTDQSLFAGQVTPFIAEESRDVEAYRKASQTVKRQASGSALTQSHSAPKKAEPSPSPAPQKCQNQTPHYRIK